MLNSCSAPPYGHSWYLLLLPGAGCRMWHTYDTSLLCSTSALGIVVLAIVAMLFAMCDSMFVRTPPFPGTWSARCPAAIVDAVPPDTVDAPGSARSHRVPQRRSGVRTGLDSVQIEWTTNQTRRQLAARLLVLAHRRGTRPRQATGPHSTALARRLRKHCRLRRRRERPQGSAQQCNT